MVDKLIQVEVTGKKSATRVLRFEDIRHFVDTQHLFYAKDGEHIPDQNCIYQPSIIIPRKGKAVVIDPLEGEMVYVSFNAYIIEVGTKLANPYYICALLNSGSIHYDYDKPPADFEWSPPSIDRIKDYILLDADIADQNEIAERYKVLNRELYNMHLGIREKEYELFTLL